MRPAEKLPAGRAYPTVPRVGVGVAIVDGHRLLMVKRAQEPKRGSWSLPGGMVELGETVREAARREVREECGIEVELTRLLDVVDFIHRDRRGRIRFHYVLVDFLGQARTKILCPGGDVEDAQWFHYDDLGGLDMPDLTREFIRQHLLGHGGEKMAGEGGGR